MALLLNFNSIKLIIVIIKTQSEYDTLKTNSYYNFQEVNL